MQSTEDLLLRSSELSQEWQQRIAELEKEEMQTRCSRKYKRPFEIKPIGDETIKRYPGEYIVKYAPCGDARSQDVPRFFLVGFKKMQIMLKEKAGYDKL